MRLLLVSVLVWGVGCGSNSSAKIRLVPNVVAGAQSGLGDTSTSESRIGSPQAVDLKSLKYYITTIQLCQEAQLSGSGFSGTQDCIALYTSDPANAPDYNQYTVEEAQADNDPGHYIDLMTAEGQATLR